jgi:hypothetical protein
MNEAERKILEDFTTEHWVDWIRRILNYELVEPTIPATLDEIHQSLARVYFSLESGAARDRFADAISILFESTPLVNANARRIDSLITLISAIKPLRAKKLVRRHLFGGALRGMEYGKRDLHTTLLVAAGKYQVDDELVDYIKRSAQRTGDYTYKLACLSILPAYGQRNFVEFLNGLIASLDEKKALQLGRQLNGILRKYGFMEFCRWFTDTLRDDSDGALCDKLEFEWMEKALTAMVFKSASVPAFDDSADLSSLVITGDAYRNVTALQVFARNEVLTPVQVVALARLHSQLDIDLIVKVLVNIWWRMSNLTDDHRGWFFEYISPKHFKQPAIIAVIARDEKKKFQFWGSQDPTLITIFDRVKNECEIGIPKAFTSNAA